jgi:hypothetical protein
VGIRKWHCTGHQGACGSLKPGSSTGRHGPRSVLGRWREISEETLAPQPGVCYWIGDAISIWMNRMGSRHLHTRSDSPLLPVTVANLDSSRLAGNP